MKIRESGEKNSSDIQPLIGGINASAAYFMWGISSLYWRCLSHVPVTTVLCYRILSSLLFLTILVFLWRKSVEVVEVIFSPRKLLIYILSAVAVALNWFAFIWGSISEHVVETSLGYFLVPVVNILLGVVLLRERLSKIRLIAVGLVIMSVLNLILNSGDLIPWIYLTIAITFGFYGFLRKIAPLSAISGLGIETLILTLPAVIFLIQNSNVVWLSNPQTKLWSTQALLLGSGVVSVIPLVCFSKATTFLKLSTLAFYQYILPTTQLILGVFVFTQKVSQPTILSFLLIWVALIFVSLEAVLNLRKSKRKA